MISLLNGLSRVILKFSRNRRAPDPLPDRAYMLVYDLSGHYNVNLSGTADISPQAEMLGAFLFSIFIAWESSDAIKSSV